MQSLQKTQFHSSEQAAFARLFPELKPLAISEVEIKKLAEYMSANETSKTDSKVFSNGLSIFGQFLAHDVTFEATSKFRGINVHPQFENHRTTTLDLDCMYGQSTQDFLYDANDKEKLLLGKYYKDSYGNRWQDLQRNAQGKAVICDARNDENIIVSQMHALFIRFHNVMVDYQRNLKTKRLFKEARQQVVWHYQWLIIHEFLNKILDEKVFKDLIENGPRYYATPEVLPLEFVGAAFRMGHSQTRDSNRINANSEKDLFSLGFFNIMDEYVDWRYIFDFGDGKVQYAKKIDTKIERLFHQIPFIKTDNKWEKSLPYRNIKRGSIYGLPSGETIACRMGFEPLEVPVTRKLGLEGTPLWYYILHEAEVLADGERMGPLGSRILGEVFFAILAADDTSYLKVYPTWKPEIGRKPGAFDFVDLINFVHKQEGVEVKKDLVTTVKKRTSNIAAKQEEIKTPHTKVVEGKDLNSIPKTMCPSQSEGCPSDMPAKCPMSGMMSTHVAMEAHEVEGGKGSKDNPINIQPNSKTNHSGHSY